MKSEVSFVKRVYTSAVIVFSNAFMVVDIVVQPLRKGDGKRHGNEEPFFEHGKRAFSSRRSFQLK